ncbi:MAG: protein kinase [Gemmatimonadales bacterium]|jgi:serine/threonine-protein kinase
MTDVLERLTAALADRYRIERELGAGGMATVYLAEDLKHERKVALKVLKPELAAVLGAERFVQEIKTTASLQHPHILPLFDSGSTDGFLYYVMPYIEGETLRDKLDRETQLGIEEAVRITTEVADALDYAHRNGVIHRDIKPENILLHDGRPMVADFGIALAVSAAAGGRMTETGLSLGTPHYMSPEQATAEKDLTNRSDIYSLAAVLYEMLTGNPPHVGASAQQIIMKIVTEQAAPVTSLRRSVPSNVVAAVGKALEKLPADRFNSAAQFSEALTNPAFSLSASAASPGGSPVRRSIITPTLAAVAILTAALAAWGWLRPHSAPAGRVARYFILDADSVGIRAGASLNLAIAPDGSRIAFVGEGGPGRLWVRRMEDLRPQPLPGTEGARWPTFSPDGRWIAFVKTPGAELQKIRADGGATVTLADSAASFGYGGVAWLDDNTIVFTTLSFGLRRVSAAGGEASELVTPQTGRGAGSATPLPGGRGVIYQSCGTDCVPSELRVLDLRTGETHPLVADANRGWYLPTGDLLYVRADGAALAAPFDLRTLTLTGSPVPVLDDVSVRVFFPQLTVANDGTLLYVPGSGTSGPDLTFVRVDHAGRATPIDTAWTGPFDVFALSHDGRRMAVTVGPSMVARDIWIKQLDRGPFTRFTFSGLDRGATWSPDGRTVAFVRDTLGGTDIYAKPADGSGEDRVIGHIDRLVQAVEYSADGSWLLVRTDNTDVGRGDIFGIRLTGDTTPVPLVTSPYEELHPTLAPDGRWLAYTSSESGQSEVYVRPFPTTSAARWQVSIGGGSHPRWAPNGRVLYYLSTEPRRLMAAELSPDSGFSVADRRMLFELNPTFQIFYYQTSFELTPEGNSFIFLSTTSTNARQTQEERPVLVENWFTELRQLMESH